MFVKLLGSKAEIQFRSHKVLNKTALLVILYKLYASQQAVIQIEATVAE